MHALLHAPLKGKHRGVLKKHHRQSAHEAIVQGKVDLARLSAIIDPAKDLSDRFSQRAKAQMLFNVHDSPYILVTWSNI
jgi:hypothetical protein